MWIALGVVALVVVVIALWWRFRDPLRGENFDKFEVKRQWGWELQLSAQEETAFMAGLRAYDDDRGSVFIHGDFAALHVSHPHMLVSMYLLVGWFRAMGPAAVSDPVPAVRQLIDRASAGEARGVLHLREGWSPGEFSNLGKDGLDVMSMVLLGPGIDGYESFYSHEDRGYGMLVVLAGGTPKSVQASYDEAYSHSTGKPIHNHLDIAKAVVEKPDPAFVEALDRADGEKSHHTNTLLIDYARIFDRYHEVRAQMAGATPMDVLGVILTRMLTEQSPGTTWVRQPSPEEQQLAMKIVATRVAL